MQLQRENDAETTNPVKAAENLVIIRDLFFNYFALKSISQDLQFIFLKITLFP